jgi:hypothetical protein
VPGFIDRFRFDLSVDLVENGQQKVVLPVLLTVFDRRGYLLASVEGRVAAVRGRTNAGGHNGDDRAVPEQVLGGA